MDSRSRRNYQPKREAIGAKVEPFWPFSESSLDDIPGQKLGRVVYTLAMDDYQEQQDVVGNQVVGAVKCGGWRYEDRSHYIGDWNQRGQKHGIGHLRLPDGTRYDGNFQNGLCTGLGCLWFSDGSKYEGEFHQGWFHGHGIFWRSDGMKFEGEFRGGRIWGLGLITFHDFTHGFPRNEGYFQDCRLMRKRRCPDVVQKAQKTALMARSQVDHPY